MTLCTTERPSKSDRSFDVVSCCLCNCWPNLHNAPGRPKSDPHFHQNQLQNRPPGGQMEEKRHSHLQVDVASNVAGGPGLTSYTDALNGGSSTSGKSFSPFSAGAPAPAAQSFSSSGPSFSGSISAQEISFTLEADSLADLVEQMRGSGGSIKLSGSIESVSFN